MPLRRMRLVLWTASAVLLITAAAAVVLGLRLPYAAAGSGPSAAAAIADAPDASSVATARPALDQWRRVWGRPLRRPLYDPPPQSKPKPPPPEPPKPPPVRLVGAIREAGRSVAMFATRGGAIELLQAGEILRTTGGVVELLAIEDQSVKVRYQGHEHTLKMQEAQSP